MILNKNIAKLWGSLLLAGSMCLNSYGKDLTKAQKKELFEKGTITIYNQCGQEKGHFEVNIIPGAENIGEAAKDQWKEAGGLMADFVDKEEFWKIPLFNHSMMVFHT